MSDKIDQQIEMQQRIETYISEGLPPDEEDQLWIEFLKQPHWYGYFKTQLHLISLAVKINID
ncbi:hypothetical protein DYD21_10070 [Rhodohalobacter sp. SW132]|uniref:hypothetical protein n=1 Tax=Rhodohalobacter sp. SW132 TaxID=2293433 RepID=UPI000E235A36|nr:hypothetical protein [Rhodohalobacter sp. SW132]REL33742.1 hypothetical protein DYD21_10070 [Rhodohalobacter sp. SW132]